MNEPETELRMDLVNRAREQIAHDPEGYASGEKLEVAVDRLLDALRGERNGCERNDGPRRRRG